MQASPLIMLQNTPHGSPVETLVRSAWRRRHGLLAIEQFSHAAALSLGGLILMLLLGTEVLRWYWPALLCVVGTIIAGLRLRGCFLSKYQIAQALDRRLQLSDTLSTAWFLLHSGPSATMPSQLQVKQAEKLAESVRLETAFPFQGQRAWTLTALLLVVACGLFAFRYLVERQLTFQHSLIPMHFGTVLQHLSPSTTSQEKPLANRRRLDMSDSNRLAHNNTPQKDGSSKTGAAQSGSRDYKPSSDSAQAGESAPNLASNDSASPPADQGKRSDESKSDALTNDANSSHTKQQSQAPAESQEANSGAAKKDTKVSPQDSSQEPSLATKLRDALSGLMQKMHLGSQPSQSNKTAQEANGLKSGKNGTDPSKAPQDNAGQNENSKAVDPNGSSSESAQQTSSNRKAAAPQAQSSDQSSGQQSSDTQSAAGRQDGSKQTLNTEQLKAIGKLAEIMGKRSSEVSGDMSVETFSGKQQLQTPDTQRLAAHSGLGGIVNHNEIPPEDQQFVRQYMKQVHQEAGSR